MPLLRHFAFAGLALASSVLGCSFGNLSHDDCESTDECANLFGLGSRCEAGYCSAAFICSTGHDCRHEFGGGACVGEVCSPTLPASPACPPALTEPPDLFSSGKLAGDESTLVIGGIFAVYDTADPELTKAARLAVREINRNGGLTDGRALGIVICDSGGPGNLAQGDERKPYVEAAVDYLSGSLGAPLIIGPTTSTESFFAINRVLERVLPTTIISPSATSPQLTDQSDRLAEEDPFGLFWRTCPSDEFQGQVLADRIEADATLVEAAVVYVQDPYGEGLATVFSQAFAGSTLLFPYSTPDDLPGLATDVAVEDPNAVVVIVTKASDTVAFLEAAATTTLAGKRFFFTDGSKDKTTLLDPTLPAGVKAIIQGAIGTGAAGGIPTDPNFLLFSTNLEADFDLDANAFGFLAHTYDATYVGALGLVFASATDPKAYDGRQVSEGLSMLVGGAPVDLLPTEWAGAKGALEDGDAVDVKGTSGNLDFDVTTGEAPGPIEIWSVNASFTDFLTDDIVVP